MLCPLPPRPVSTMGCNPPHSKRSLAAIPWSAGACSRFLLPGRALHYLDSVGALLAAPADTPPRQICACHPSNFFGLGGPDP